MIIKSNSRSNCMALRFVIYIVIIVHIAVCNVSCSVKKEKERCIYDIHGAIIKRMDKNHAVYVMKDGRSLTVSLNDVDYKYSRDDLTNDIYNNIQINHECNIRQLFFVLFDKDLNILEVRAADMSNPAYIRCPDINKYIESIKSTQGNWICKKTSAPNDLHLFVFSMLVY